MLGEKSNQIKLKRGPIDPTDVSTRNIFTIFAIHVSVNNLTKVKIKILSEHTDRSLMCYKNGIMKSFHSNHIQGI